MDKSGKSVLWFLGACLLFSQSLMAFVSKTGTNISAVWILLFGFLCLVSVLLSLLTMFIRNPAFLTAERGDLVPLSLIQLIARDNNPDLLKQLILNLSPKQIDSNEIDERENVLEEGQIQDSDVDEGENEGVEDSEDYQAALKEIMQ